VAVDTRSVYLFAISGKPPGSKNPSMPFVLLLLVALTVASLVTVLAAHYPHTAGVSQPSDKAAAQVGHVIAEHERLRRLRRVLGGRLDPTTATGLALSLALLVILVAGLVIGTLAYLIRSNSELAAIDRSVGQWGVDHRHDWSTDALQLFTWLGDTRLIVPLALVLAIVEYVRRPSRWILPFLLAVVAGNVLLVTGIKDVLDRVRPEFNPMAETLGPSFPSGHSAGAAAFWCAVALLVARGRTPHQRALIFGIAAGVAAGVACSRVMLGVHWLSDVIAGVLFGWAWFCACSIAFGGRLLRFGASAEKAAGVADEEMREHPRPRPARASSSYGS
jgi:membrane-associated phospholipid phosphatase